MSHGSPEPGILGSGILVLFPKPGRTPASCPDQFPDRPLRALDLPGQLEGFLDRPLCWIGSFPAELFFRSDLRQGRHALYPTPQQAQISAIAAVRLPFSPRSSAHERQRTSGAAQV